VGNLIDLFLSGNLPIRDEMPRRHPLRSTWNSPNGNQRALADGHLADGEFRACSDLAGSSVITVGRSRTARRQTGCSGATQLRATRHPRSRKSPITPHFHERNIRLQRISRDSRPCPNRWKLPSPGELANSGRCPPMIGHMHQFVNPRNGRSPTTAPMSRRGNRYRPPVSGSAIAPLRS